MVFYLNLPGVRRSRTPEDLRNFRNRNHKPSGFILRACVKRQKCESRRVDSGNNHLKKVCTPSSSTAILSQMHPSLPNISQKWSGNRVFLNSGGTFLRGSGTHVIRG